jgi:hypothetical protein
MKNLLLSLAIIGALFTACKKESGDEATPATQNGNKSIPTIGVVPQTFTKKAFIESFTSASSGKCPETDALVENMISNNPGRVIAASIHDDDRMSTSFIQTVRTTFNNGANPSVPCYMISRIPIANKVFISNQQMQNATNKSFNITAKCGLAINTTIVGRKGYAEVHAGFNQTLFGNHNITVYLVEDNVSKTGSGYDQANNYNLTASSAYFNMGDPIVGYTHQHVLRSVITNGLGSPINPNKMIPGGQEIQTYVFDLPYTINLSNAYIIAFVNKPGATPIQHEVLNVQIVKLGSMQAWD